MTIRKKLVSMLAALGLAAGTLVVMTNAAAAGPGEQAASSKASGQELALAGNSCPGVKLTQRPKGFIGGYSSGRTGSHTSKWRFCD